ncbi:MAG: phosphatase [uncultured bacterium]|nr:MAG: phosphatase [uncultured bacterium]
MADMVGPLLQWLNANPQLAGFVTFLISAGESIAIFGTIVPGSITMTAIGTLAGAGIIPLWGTIFWAVFGAIVGDGISYWIGHYFKNQLRNIWPFKSNPNILKKGEKFVHKYGVMSVFTGRFVGPVRALVPVVAGMLGMKPLQFTIANVTSAIIWAPAYMLPGILLGAASLELPPDIALHVMMVFFLIIFALALFIWITVKILSLVHIRVSHFQDVIWKKMKKFSLTAPITVLLKHHEKHKTHGQLSLAIFFIFTTTAFILLAWSVKNLSLVTITINDAVFHLFRGIRNPDLDNTMLIITLLGQKQVILTVLFVISLWLALCKQWRIAFDTLALGVFASVSVYVIKHFLQIERPWGIATNPETFSMPSGHTTLATTIFIGLAFLITRSFRPGYRWPIFAISVSIAIAVGISRLYLGAHWFTDIAGAWLLSAALLTIIIIAFQRHQRPHINPLHLFLIGSLSFLIALPSFYYLNNKKLLAQYEQVEWPIIQINLQNWWQKNEAIPAYRASLFGFPSQRINVEWVGNIDKIRDTLINQGWSKPPVRDWISTLHRIADVSSTQYLPLISPQYLDRKPEIILTRIVSNHDGEKSLMFIRLWNANRFIKNSQMPLWVGIVGIVPRSYNWLFKKHSDEIDISINDVFPIKSLKTGWQTKIISITPPINHKPKKYRILLIKPTHFE